MNTISVLKCAEKSVDVNVIGERAEGDEGQEIENVCTVRRGLAVVGSNFALFVKIRTECVRGVNKMHKRECI